MIAAIGVKLIRKNKTNSKKANYFSTIVTQQLNSVTESYTLVQFGNSLVTILSIFLPIPPENMQTNNKKIQGQSAALISHAHQKLLVLMI